MSLGNDDGGQQQVAKSDSSPWSGQQPFLTKGFERADTLLQSDQPQFFPNSTVVPFSSQTEGALQGQEYRAKMGSPLNAGAQGEALKTIQGDYLNGGNPEYANMVEQSIQPLRREYQETVRPGIDARFAMGGRSGSNIAGATAQNNAADNYMRNVGNVSSSLGFQNYNAERGRQQSAMGMAPTLANTDYQDIAQLGQVGAIREQKGAEQLQDQISRFNFDQNKEAQKLRDYMTAISGGQFGGSQTTQSPIMGANPWLTGIGASAAGAGALGSLFGKGGVWPGAMGS